MHIILLLTIEKQQGRYTLETASLNRKFTDILLTPFGIANCFTCHLLQSFVKNWHNNPNFKRLHLFINYYISCQLILQILKNLDNNNGFINSFTEIGRKYYHDK